MKIKYVNIIIISLLSIFIFSNADAAREDKIKPPQKDVKIKYTRFSIAPYLTGGWIIGDGADYIESNYKALYGLGTSFSYNLKPKFSLFAGLEVVYGNVSEFNSTKYRVISYTGGLYFTFSPTKKSSMYLKGETGYAQVRATNAGLDYGTHPFVKLGIGNRIFSSPTIATWIEIYYKRILNNDKDLEYYFIEEGIDAEYVGLLISVSFGI